MRKIKLLIILFLFIFFTTLNVNAEDLSSVNSNATDYYKDYSNLSDYEMSQNGYYTNLIDLGGSQIGAIDFYSAQRFSDSSSIYGSEYTEKYSDGRGVWLNSSHIIYGTYNNVSSFDYGFTAYLDYNFEKDKKYQIEWVFNSSKELDAYPLDTYLEDFIFSRWTGNGATSPVSFKRFYFTKEDNVNSDAIHYHFILQFIPSESFSGAILDLGTDGETVNYNPFAHENSIKLFENLTNKNLQLDMILFYAFEVENFQNGSGIIHDGGGMTFDGERTDSNTFFSTLESCDSTDIVCHIRNIFNSFKLLLIRISNGFEQIIKTISSFVSDLVSGLTDGLKSLFIPRDGFIETCFDATKKFLTEKLGILVYPIDLLLNVLERFNNISSPENAVIHIPNISIGDFGVVIKEKTFILNEHWNNEPYSTLYNIYIAFVNCFIGFCLYKLAYKKYEQIVGGVSD